jgi:hypothetical protein
MGRRGNWTQPRRRRPPKRTTAPEEASVGAESFDDGAGESMAAAEQTRKVKPMGTAAKELFARWGWVPDYAPIFRWEMETNRQLVKGQVFLQPSTYRARLHGRAAEVYDERRRMQERDQMAIMLHANNQQDWSPSMLYRSVAYWNQTSTLVQQAEGRQRRLASRPVTFEFMRLMRDCRPLPAWSRGEHVEFFVADQTYEWVGVKKHGRRSTVERHDHRGMPVALKHEVYVNSIRLSLPSILGTLSMQDQCAIRANHGSPYTEPFNSVFAPLDFQTVDDSLLDLAIAALQPINTMLRGHGAATSPASLTLADVAHALFGRGNVDPGGPSHFDILEPLMECDTKSYDDFVKIFAYLGSQCDPSTIVRIFAGDGQSIIRAKDVKRRWPHQYASWLVVPGGFHEHAHSMFAFTELFNACFVRYMLDELDISRVMPITHNLEHNAYAYHQNAHHVITIACVSYLLQDVTHPPPALFLRNPDLCLQQVQHAGGIVLLRYLRHAGFPTLQWQRAARDGNGAKLKLLFAYSFHCCRAVHKPVCTQVLLIGLLGMCCALPALQLILLSVTSLSLLGRLSANMYLDRMLELINSLQQGSKRSASKAGFGRAMDMTSLLRVLLHVKHAFHSHETGETDSGNPITPSMLVQARLLQNAILKEIGRDLTLHHTDNPFHMTRNPVPLFTNRSSDAQTRRPWEFIERVAYGLSRGIWRMTAETAPMYIRRWLSGHSFPF